MMKLSLIIRVLAILLCFCTPCVRHPSPHNHDQFPLNVRYHHHLLLSHHNLKINNSFRFHCSACKKYNICTHHHLQETPVDQVHLEDFHYPAVTMSSLLSGTEYEHLEPSTLLSNPDIINLY